MAVPDEEIRQMRIIPDGDHPPMTQDRHRHKPKATVKPTKPAGTKIKKHGGPKKRGRGR